MPTNLYGEGDNDLNNSHVLPALSESFMRQKIAMPKKWLFGYGTPKREFLYADDLAEACILMKNYDGKD